MRESKNTYIIHFNKLYALSCLSFISSFSVVLSVISVISIKINLEIISMIAEYRDRRIIVYYSIIAISIQIVLFLLNYLQFVAEKLLHNKYRNKYTDIMLETVFYGKSEDICAYNKSDIIYYSIDLVSDYVSSFYNILNGLIGTVIGMIIYIISFKNEFPAQIILIIGVIYFAILLCSNNLCKKIAKLVDESIALQNNLNTLTSEYIDNSEDIRLSGIQGSVFNKINNIINNVKANNRKSVSYNLISTIIRDIPNIIFMIILFCYIYRSILDGASIESYFLIVPVANSFIVYFGSLLSFRENYMKNSKLRQRIFSFAKIEREKVVDYELTSKIVNISTRNITYSYDNDNYITLPDIISKAPSISLIQGKSGSGKTTLLRILSGLLTPLYGSVTYINESGEALTPLQCKQAIGYNPQMSFIYNATILDNITLGDDFSNADIMKALKKANAYDFVIKKPDGLNTMLGIGGKELSGGERQRITLARTLIRQPNILFLDESLSSLDQENRKEIYNNIKNENSICFLVSHQDDFLEAIDGVTRYKV